MAFYKRVSEKNMKVPGHHIPGFFIFFSDRTRL